MRRLFLSAGHTNVPGKDRGAVSKIDGVTYIEGDLAARFVQQLYDECKKRGLDVYKDPFQNDLAAAMKAISPAVHSNDIAIEYHWNSAANPNAKGSEVVVPGRAGKGIEATPFEFKWANDLSRLYSTILQTPNRGVKQEHETPHKSLGWMRIPAENLLVEIGFISCKQDVMAYFKFEHDLVQDTVTLFEQMVKS